MESNEKKWPFPPLVFGEGVQVTVNQIAGDQNNEYHIERAYFGDQAANAFANVDADAGKLHVYVSDKEARESFVARLAACTTAKEVAVVVKDIYDYHVENEEIIASRAFIATIQPYLKFEKGASESNLRDYIQQVVLGKY